MVLKLLITKAAHGELNGEVRKYVNEKLKGASRIRVYSAGEITVSLRQMILKLIFHLPFSVYMQITDNKDIIYV